MGLFWGEVGWSQPGISLKAATPRHNRHHHVTTHPRINQPQNLGIRLSHSLFFRGINGGTAPTVPDAYP